MTSQQPRQALVGYVLRCRRRLQWLLFARYAVVAVSTSIGVAGALIFVVRADRAQAAAWLGAALVSGLATAACAAAWRRPGPQSTAAALDKELQLEDRVAAALQFLPNDDPVAGLIVRDAAARLSGLVPAQVFHFDLRISRRAMLLPAAAAVLATAAAILPEPGRRAFAAGLGGSSFAGGSVQVASKPPDGTNREAAPATPSTTTSTAVVGNTAVAVERTPAQRENAESLPRRDANAQDESLTGRPPERHAQDAARPLPTDAAPAGASSGGEESRGPGPQSSIGEGRVGDAAARGSQKGAGSGGAGASGPQGRGGGGISAGSASNAFFDRRRIRVSADRSYAAEYRGAWARVQAALARNEVPASFRTYLRDYFVAIRPSSENDHFNR